MSIFRKPSLADIYVRELSGSLDPSLVPLFTPDTAVEIGTTGRFVEGRFETTGTLAQLGVPTVEKSLHKAASDWAFTSGDSVQLEPQGEVPGPLGTPLLTARLRFSGDRAVVAAFSGVKEANPSQALDDILWQLYADGRLDPDEVVISYLRTAESGTVVVNRKRDVSVELLADPSVVGAVLSMQALGLGVTFGAGRQASFQLSGRRLVPFVRAKGLSKDLRPRIEHVRKYAPVPGQAASEFEGLPVPYVQPDAPCSPTWTSTPRRCDRSAWASLGAAGRCICRLRGPGTSTSVRGPRLRSSTAWGCCRRTGDTAPRETDGAPRDDRHDDDDQRAADEGVGRGCVEARLGRQRQRHQRERVQLPEKLEQEHSGKQWKRACVSTTRATSKRINLTSGSLVMRSGCAADSMPWKCPLADILRTSGPNATETAPGSLR